MKGIKTFIFIATIAFVRSGNAETGTVWSASVDNGDKPGIGLRLVQSQRGFSGAGYLLDPEHPHDFSRGSKRKIDVISSTTEEIRFKIDWGDGMQRSYVLRFDAPLESSPVNGTLREESADDEPTKLKFTPAKPK